VLAFGALMAERAGPRNRFERPQASPFFVTLNLFQGPVSSIAAVTDLDPETSSG